MENKLNRSELFAVCVILLYGSFASTKYALTMGNYALPATALALLFELILLGLIVILPTVKSNIFGFLLSLFPLCTLSVRVYGGAGLLKNGDFGYIPFSMILLSSLLLCVYLALKNISSSGRVAVIILICTALLLVFLTAVYAKDLDASNIIGDFSDKTGAEFLIFSSLSELVMIYLAKSFFAREENDRAAKPPLEKPLPEKERRKLYFKITFIGFFTAATLRLAVTAALLSLADSRLYALSENVATFAARLLYGINLSPLISGGVYILTLFAFSFSLCLTVQFAKGMRRGNFKP